MFENWLWMVVVAALLIPVLGIVAGIGYSITARVSRHRERMAMIERGIDPNRKPVT